MSENAKYIDARLDNEPGRSRWVEIRDHNGNIVERMTPGRARAFGQLVTGLANELYET